jgi:hypothetical protein
MEDAYGKAFDYYKAQRANMELQKSLDIIS